MSILLRVDQSQIAEPKIRYHYAYTPPPVEDHKAWGKVYILQLEIEGEQYLKIGVSSRPVQQRTCEILTSLWHRLRYFPKCYVKRYTSMVNPYDFEAEIHQSLNQYRVTLPFKFDGSTELFGGVDLEYVTDLYDEMTKVRKK